MKAQTISSLPPAGTNYESVRCLLAIELHCKKNWIVAITTALSGQDQPVHIGRV